MTQQPVQDAEASQVLLRGQEGPKPMKNGPETTWEGGKKPGIFTADSGTQHYEMQKETIRTENRCMKKEGQTENRPSEALLLSLV